MLAPVTMQGILELNLTDVLSGWDINTFFISSDLLLVLSVDLLSTDNVEAISFGLELVAVFFLLEIGWVKQTEKWKLLLLTLVVH